MLLVAKLVNTKKSQAVLHAAGMFNEFTLMQVVANLANTKSCKIPEKCLKPWHMGTHLRVHRKSYPMNTNKTGFKFSEKLCVLVLWT